MLYYVTVNHLTVSMVAEIDQMSFCDLNYGPRTGGLLIFSCTHNNESTLYVVGARDSVATFRSLLGHYKLDNRRKVQGFG